MSSLHALWQRLSIRFGWKRIALSAGLLMSGTLLGATLLLAGCKTGVPLQILWTNDTHGFFMPVYHAEFTEVDSYAQRAITEGKVGGYAQIAGLVKKMKEGIWERRTLFVDGGDTFDGSPVAQLTRGAAVIPVLNAMGYDAMVPGNRDFAWPKDNFLAVTGEITFPIVCANLMDKDTGAYVFPRYIIKRVDGLKVAIIGITSPLAGNSSTGFTVTGGSLPAAFAIEDDISALAAEIRAQESANERGGLEALWLISRSLDIGRSDRR